MKITLFLLLGMMTAAHAEAQRITLEMKQVRLEKVFLAIAEQTDFRFLYSDEVIGNAETVDVDLRGATIDNAMMELLKGQRLAYRIIAKTVIVNDQNASYIVEGHPAIVQTSVSGTVRGVGGQALSGVGVRVQGPGGATTTTNDDGHYRITAPTNGTLVFSYLGYQPQEVQVTENTIINIQLEEMVNELAEVDIVATGYQRLDRQLFTGAVSQLKAEDVQRTGVADITRMLEGQAAGVTLQNVSGTFGAAPKLRIRGATSLSGDNKPLWVIDGIIQEDVVNISNEALSTGDASTLLGSSVAGINPDDIESFDILKDAAATAMYGARAMNGVIVVTTKKGRQTEGAPRINFTSNFTTYAKPDYANFDILNSADQMSIMIELLNKGHYQIPGASRGADGGVFFKMYNLLYDYNEETDTWGLKNDVESRNEFLERYANANTDWFDVIFKNSLMQEYSLSLSSGTERFQTYASTSYLHDGGQAIGNSVERLTGNFRANFKLSDKFSGEILTSGAVRNQRAPGTSSLQSDPVYGSYYRGFDINPYNYVMNTSRLIRPYDEDGELEYFIRDFAPFNILNEMNSNYMKLNTIDFKVQMGLNYQIIPALKYAVNGALRYSRTEDQTYILENSNMVKSFQARDDATIEGSNPNLYEDPDLPNELPFTVLPSGGFYKMGGNNLKSYYFRHQLEYDKSFTEDHRLNAFGSMEIRYIDRQNEFFDGVGYQFDNGGLVSPYYRYFKQAAEEGKPYFGMGFGYDRFVAYMFRAAYAYQRKYSLNFTTRYDGSNLMGKSTIARWLPTWNISGAWNIDNEPFWPENSVLTAARLRGTYGLVANMGNATNSAAVFYNQIARRPYINDQETLTYISSLENSGLTWEKLKELNIGLDLGLINDRLNVSIDAYDRKIFDLIASIQTSGIGGEYTKVGNYGKMVGKGLEFTIEGAAIRNTNFQWFSRFNFAFNRNEITELDINQNIWRTVSANGGPVEGYPQRGLFSVQFAGLNPDYGYPTFIGLGESKPVTTYINLQSDELDNLKYEGPVDAIFAGGFYNRIRYKDFTVSGLIKFSAGNVLRLTPRISNYYTDLYSMTKDMLNRWVMPGDEAHTSVPAILDGVSQQKIVDDQGGQVDARYPYNIYNYSTERAVRGDYIKLSQIALSYNLPASIYKRLRMTNAALTVVGNNLWVIYADKRLNGQDPEFFASGGVAMPVPTQFTLSLKAGF